MYIYLFTCIFDTSVFVSVYVYCNWQACLSACFRHWSSIILTFIGVPCTLIYHSKGTTMGWWPSIFYMWWFGSEMGASEWWHCSGPFSLFRISITDDWIIIMIFRLVRVSSHFLPLIQFRVAVGLQSLSSAVIAQFLIQDIVLSSQNNSDICNSVLIS